MDIQDQLNCFNTEYNFGEDFVERAQRAYIEDCEATSEPHYLTLFDFIDTASFRVKEKRKKRKKKIRSSDMEVYEGPLKQRNVNDKNSDVNKFRANFYTSHNLSKDTINYLKDLQSTRSYVHFSRLGKSLRGSTKILVSKYKIAFLLLWNVDDGKYKIRLVPILNCSSIQNAVICKICETFPKKMNVKFEKQINEKNGKILTNQHDEQLFCFLSEFICSNEISFSTEMIEKLIYLGEKSMNSPLENILKKTKTVLVDRAKDYFDIYASSNDDCEYTVNDLLKGDSLDSDNICPICFDEFDNDDVQIMTCGHKACASCWK